jgi:glycerate dehydrogenase
MAGATVAVTNKVPFDRELIHKLPDLKLICVAATGVNCIDLEAASEAGIEVCNVQGYSTATVAETTALMILSLSHSFVPYVEDVKRGLWPRASHFCLLNHPISEVRGKKLGILGYGNLGREVARVMSTFGMKILIVEHSNRSIDGALPLSTVLKEADFFTIHVPLTPHTRDLIGKRELEQMKRSAFLINVARGGIVNEEALAQALLHKVIAGAAVDVLSQEPPPENHPLLNPAISNLLITPHVAWASLEARDKIIQITRENIERFLNRAVL